MVSARSRALLACFLLAAGALPACAKAPKTVTSEGPAYRFERGGWTYVHLEGSPAEIGYQHGRLLAPEIADMIRVAKIETLHSTHRDWKFYREAGRTMFWPHIETEYQQELAGIAKGVQSRGVKLDVWDIVALNGDIELPEYYVPWLDKHEHAANAPAIRPEGRCSAFIATGSYTKDGRIVMGHSNWSGYADGERWTIIFDIKPEHGHRMVMDGEPGVITSEDDFGMNDAGLMITETTITQFEGWNPNGIPEFVRSRKAMQYASTIDEYIALMKEGNNGGYANDWLIGDRRTGEIAYLELGLKNTPVWRSKDGYFISSNFARDRALIKNETDGFDPTNLASSPNARRVTWEDKMASSKGHIDVSMAEMFLADHTDSYTGKVNADSRSLCGHVDRDPRGVPEWDEGPYAPEGAVTGKVTDSVLAEHLEMIARAGHPCGEDFLVKPFLAAHPQYDYLKPVLRDMKAGPWTQFGPGEKP
ncbi:MAG TPA: C45 family peptidase [Terracidiphilus sp.]|nr:C45 family peptidase [Terracidiphilus sp.]